MDFVCEKLKEADEKMSNSSDNIKKDVIERIEDQEKFSGKTAIVIYDFI